MKRINIIGLISDFDNVIANHIMKTEMHFENTMDVFRNVNGLYPFSDDNPYSDLLAMLKEIAGEVGVADNDEMSYCRDVQAAERYARALSHTLKMQKEKLHELQEQLKEDEMLQKQLEPMQNVSIKLDKLFHFKYIKVRFGQMPRDSYLRLPTYLSDRNAFFFQLGGNDETVFGVYFAPAATYEQVDNIFASLYFERVRISDRAAGYPKEELAKLEKEIEQLTQNIAELEKDKAQILAKEKNDIIRSYQEVKFIHEVFECRKYAAHTNESFYLVGWVTEENAIKLEKSFEGKKSVTFLAEDASAPPGVQPPTLLKNHKLFAPFEGFVEMYGIPAYGEIDPTFILGLTYTLMYGIMFGDIAHGLLLLAFGCYMKYAKKSFIGGVLILAGISGTFFGVMYGSIFGYEEIFQGLWYKPMHSNGDMTNTLIYAVALGAFFITMSMILNIYNCIKRKHIGELLFSPNGIIGLIFFWSLIIMVLSTVLGWSLPQPIFSIAFIALPILLLFLREPLEKLIDGHKDWLPKSFGAFFLETFFEMFEVLLSYLTNLISFVRVGAYALIHAGMLMVVMMFVESTTGVTSVIILVLGNLFVVGMEALLVAIQVLRLEFYEMFSRFYSGNGKPFKAHKINTNN